MTSKLAIAAAALLAGAAVASSAAAVTYSAVGDFSALSSTGVWSYGTGVTGTSFTAMTSYSSACEGAAGLGCWQSPTPVDRVPLVLKNFTGSTQDVYSSVVQPADVLNVHPGPSTDAIVTFTAPTTSRYKITGFFETLDVSPTGVNVIFGGGDDALQTSFLGGPAASFPNTVGGVVSFNRIVTLNAGQTYAFGVNNAGSYYNDSTGLSATISAVPEPATWAMFIIGFGLIGAAMRREDRKLADLSQTPT